MILLETGVYCSVLSDPGVPDGEQIVWRVTKDDSEPEFSTITWRVSEWHGKPVYEITLDSDERKHGKYIIDKSDLRLIQAHVLRDTEDGISEVNVVTDDEYQYLIHNFKNKVKDERIDRYPDSYDGMVLPFSLRGFPFGKRGQVELRITPPFKPTLPTWAWKMWKSYVRSLGVEKVTVPAGTFDCYKLEIAASSGIIRRFTSKYYIWFAKEPPHHFVKFQRENGSGITELVEISCPYRGE